MNILPKKRWHVRTKENVARVRRGQLKLVDKPTVNLDEAKAAAGEKSRAERVALAEHEDRLRRLKTNRSAEGFVEFTAKTESSNFNDFGANVDANSASVSSHVNLFADLEDQERKNLTIGNKEYEAEKKKEKDDWESKMGIMKRFAEDTKEYAKEKYWWEDIPLVREAVAPKPSTHQQGSKLNISTSAEDAIRPSRFKKEEKRVKKRKKKRHRSSSGSSSDEDRKKKKLAKLRQERLERERLEQFRTKQLFEPKKEVVEQKTHLEQDRSRQYNSLFNPDFAKPKSARRNIF